MPAVRNAVAVTRRSLKGDDPADTASTNGQVSQESTGGQSTQHQAGNAFLSHQAIKLRRSARLASKYKYVVRTDKPIVPNRRLLERERPPRSLGMNQPISPLDLVKRPAWPIETPAHGNRKLRRESSFVLVDCGTHFEMVSPKVANYLPRVPPKFETIAPYHNFGSRLSDEVLGKKLGATLVKNDKHDPEAKVGSSGISQSRKRPRSEDNKQGDNAAP